MQSEALERGSASIEEAATRVDRLKSSNTRRQALRRHLRGDQQLYASATGRGDPRASGNVRGQVALWRIPRSETWPGCETRLDSIDPEGPPILAVRVPG